LVFCGGEALERVHIAALFSPAFDSDSISVISFEGGLNVQEEIEEVSQSFAFLKRRGGRPTGHRKSQLPFEFR